MRKKKNKEKLLYKEVINVIKKYSELGENIAELIFTKKVNL